MGFPLFLFRFFLFSAQNFLLSPLRPAAAVAPFSFKLIVTKSNIPLLFAMICVVGIQIRYIFLSYTHLLNCKLVPIIIVLFCFCFVLFFFLPSFLPYILPSFLFPLHLSLSSSTSFFSVSIIITFHYILLK
ncbi:hypothetical protein, unlikely [Trypanosoma brucei gambiense DAL972]|uniref:Uncharacterized protein n=1 Tax=Trypanosoma brucei gambiense (strain MHOM/CI/86/DAL972) TaxID=679716 RepID=D0A7H4_TRYB9|nr:hypothetical protein, unlikely [Trypanosoma brucei gambiense DAL972]CBH17625.1 hypothetical protein, unlikely [Trypanosoma brucei gambiense DAL972]|eukprot:XP_011779889.1 hypothetical protein, unlikely [Trypanosoma brucei gambiense DAL972]